jgi:riboflavin biosynthesis pyrimidine reductase
MAASICARFCTILRNGGSRDCWLKGGAAVAQGFLDRGLADRLEIFRSPVVAGAGGRAAPVFPLENYTPAGTPGNLGRTGWSGMSGGRWTPSPSKI